MIAEEQQNLSVNLQDHKFNSRVPNSLYPLFVSTDNFKRNVNLPIADVVMQRHNCVATQAQSESYTLNIAPKRVYSSAIPRGIDELKLTFSKIQFPRDVALYSSGPNRNGTTLTDYNVTMNVTDFGTPTELIAHSSTTSFKNPVSSTIGIPCVMPGAVGWCHDPLNNMLGRSTISWGNNAHAVQTDIHQLLLDAEYRTFSIDSIVDYLKIPDKYATYASVTSIGPEGVGSVSFKRQYIHKFVSEIQDWAEAAKFDQKAVTTSFLVQGFKNSCIEEINFDWNNPLSTLRRGRLFPGVKDQTFTKAIESPNYEITINAITGLLNVTATAPTTALYAYNYNGYVVPSKIKDNKNIELLPDIQQGFFYFNDTNLFSYGEQNLLSDQQFLLFGPHEPANQALIQTLTFRGLESDIFNDCLSSTQHEQTFTNMNKLQIDLTYRNDWVNWVLKTIIPYESKMQSVIGASLGKLWLTSSPASTPAAGGDWWFNGLSCNNVTPAQWKDLANNVEATIVRPYIKLKSIGLPESMLPLPITTIPLIRRLTTVQAMSISDADSNGRITMRLNAITLSKVPELLMIQISAFNPTNKKYASQFSTCSRCRIHNVSIDVDGADPVLTSFTERDFFNCSKRYLKNYKWEDIVGYETNYGRLNSVMTPATSCNFMGYNNEYSQSVVPTNIVVASSPGKLISTYSVRNNTNPMVSATGSAIAKSQSNGITRVSGCGSIICLKPGLDFALSKTNPCLAPSVSISGVTMNITITYSKPVDFPDGITFEPYSYVTLYNDSMLTLNRANCEASEDVELLSQNDIKTCINVFNNSVKSGKLYMNINTYRHEGNMVGGGLMDMVRNGISKISKFVPQMISHGRNAVDLYNKNKDKIGDVMNTASNVMNKVENYSKNENLKKFYDAVA